MVLPSVAGEIIPIPNFRQLRQILKKVHYLNQEPDNLNHKKSFFNFHTKALLDKSTIFKLIESCQIC